MRKCSFIDDHNVAWIRIDEIPRLIKMFEKVEIKHLKEEQERYLQAALDAGEDVDIRHTKEHQAIDRKNMQIMLKALALNFKELDRRLKNEH